MKYGFVAWVVLAGCLASSAARPQQPGGVVPAPKVLRPLALKPGQWARYRERDAKGEIGQMKLEAVATSLCGTWVRATLAGRGTKRTWLLCIGDHGATPRERITRALVDDGAAGPIDPATPGPYAADLDVLGSRIVAPDFWGAYGRDDVTVPAGEFEEALVAQDVASTTWLHPLVPFAGVVKISGEGGREDVLDDFGDTALDVADRFVEEQEAARRQRPFVAVGLAISEQAAEVSPYGLGEGTGRLGVLGWHRSRVLDIIGEVGRLSAEDLLHENHTTAIVGGGVRYSPLRRAVNAGVGLEPYVQAIAGFAEIDGNVGGVGAMTGAGCLAGRGGDWGVAVQVDLLAARFAHNTVGALALGVWLQLEIR